MRPKRVALLLVLPVCAALLAYFLWPSIYGRMLAEQRCSDRAILARMTLFHIGLAAVKYEHCVGSPPAGIDDLIQAGLVVTAPRDGQWDVPGVGSIHGALAKRVRFSFAGPAGTQPAFEESAPSVFIRLEGEEENAPMRRVQTQLADMRMDLRQGLTTDLHWWLTDCDADGSQADSGEPASQPGARMAETKCSIAYAGVVLSTAPFPDGESPDRKRWRVRVRVAHVLTNHGRVPVVEGRELTLFVHSVIRTFEVDRHSIAGARFRFAYMDEFTDPYRGKLTIRRLEE